MAINYPTSLDDSSTLPDPGSSSPTDTPSHAGLHDNENAAIKAVEAKMGIGASTPAITTVLRSASNNTSVWGKLVLTTDVTGTLPVTNGGTGVGTSTGTGNVVLSTGPTLSGGTFGGSPTLSTPTIADFTNATHTHANAAGGGLLNGANAITDGTLTPAELTAGTGSTWVTATITPTKIGWASTTKNVWQYIQIGKMVWLYFDVSGTSNATSTSVTLPVAARSISATNLFEGTYGLGVDNTSTIVTQPRWSIDLSASATLLNFYTSFAGGGWTASGIKQIRGYILYEVA